MRSITLNELPYLIQELIQNFDKIRIVNMLDRCDKILETHSLPENIKAPIQKIHSSLNSLSLKESLPKNSSNTLNELEKQFYSILDITKLPKSLNIEQAQQRQTPKNKSSCKKV